MKYIVIILILVAVTAGGGAAWKFDLFSSSGQPTDNGKASHVVKRQTLKIVLTERGTLKAKNSTKIVCEAHGKIAQLIDEGKSVKKGEVLVELDKEDTQNRLETHENQITQLEAELKSATTEELIQVGQNKTDIEKAQLALEVAQVELRKHREATVPAKERELKLGIEEAEIKLTEAKDSLKVAEELFKEEFSTAYDVEQAKLALKRAENNVETAKMNWASYRDYDLPLETKKKESAVTEAERGLERAQKRAEAQLSAKQARVQQKKVQLSRVSSQIKRTQKQLDKMTIRAPTDGTVLYGDPDNPWNVEHIKVGGQVWHNMTLMTLPDPSEMAAVVQVHEADIDKVKLKMPAFITSEMQKDVIFDGEVIKIGTVANAGRRWGGDNVKRFKVELTLRGENLNLKPGTSARVEIQIGEVPDVLAIPLQAVFAKEGKHYCYRSNGGKPERVEVEPGRSNESFVEVKSGLDEGDKVLLYDPEIAEQGDEGESDREGETKETSEP
ncbi:MAG: efflux RND transporter periplasmic adaptor subunit [Planctomycetota bacterium]